LDVDVKRKKMEEKLKKLRREPKLLINLKIENRIKLLKILLQLINIMTLN